MGNGAAISHSYASYLGNHKYCELQMTLDTHFAHVTEHDLI